MQSGRLFCIELDVLLENHGAAEASPDTSVDVASV